jgi:Ca2+-transporting ATPase
MLVFIELLRSFSVRSETQPLWRMGLFTNARLAAVVAVSFALQIAAHHVSPLRALLQTSVLSWTDCIGLLGVALLPLAVFEGIKLLRSRSPAAVT